MGEVNEAFEEELEEDEKAPDLTGKPTGDSARKSYVRIHSLGFGDFLSKPELLRATVDSGFEHPSEGLEEEEAAVAVLPIKNKKGSKKRAACDPAVADTENLGDIVLVGHEGKANGAQIDDVINEPTMGEKLANLYLQDKNEIKNIENEESSQLIKPPSADSVHVLMKQALRADDQTLLLNCLHTQDEKVIINSVALLSPSDVLKLLDSLISMVHSRGAVLVHALPWLRSLLLQHASSIMSQESSLLALNSLYQLIESRVSTLVPALQLSSHLDLLYKGTLDDGIEENDTITPVIFEDKDESEEEEEESDDAMGNGGDDDEPFDDDSDIDEMNFG